MKGKRIRRGRRTKMGEKEEVIWLGDFNRHHPILDEERNVHLFTKTVLEAAQLLLDMISNYNMFMALAKDIPTLEACTTKNYTRVNNIFCSVELHDRFVSCDTYPQWQPQKTDHMLIISVLEIEPDRAIHAEKHNYRLTDWDEFRKSLANNLAEMQELDEFNTTETCLNQIDTLDKAIKGAIKEHVPMTKKSPYAKRWWNKELENLKKQKECLARRSYRRRAIDEDPIHEEFRKAQNNYSTMIQKTKDEHWMEWLENLDEEGVWTTNRMVSGPATDRG